MRESIRLLSIPRRFPWPPRPRAPTFSWPVRRQTASQDRDPRRRRSGARPCGAGAQAIRRALANSGRDHPQSQGVFPEAHPLSLGVFGYAGTHHSRMALLDAPPDLLIVLASGLNERDTMHWSLQLKPNAAICVNLAPASIGMHSEGGGVVGDCGAFLNYLLERSAELKPPMQATLAERSGWVSDIQSKPRLQDVEHCASDAIPIHPARAISELRRVFPRDGILLVDSGAHRAFAGHYWEAYEPRTYISATNLGPMGWAIPAAIGVQCAQPQRRVAVITGDGCMHMNGIEVSTAARYKLPIVFVVINNAALGNVWLRAHKLGPVPDETDAFARS